MTVSRATTSDLTDVDDINVDPLLMHGAGVPDGIPGAEGRSMLDALRDAVDEAVEDIEDFRMPIEYQHPALPEHALIATYRILGRAERKALEPAVKAVTNGRPPKTPEHLARIHAIILAAACTGVWMLDGDTYRPLDPETPVLFDGRLVNALKLEGALESGADIVRAVNSELVRDDATGALRRQPVDQAVYSQGQAYADFCARPTGDRDPFEVGFPMAR